VDAHDFGSYQQAKVGRERHVAVDHHQSAQRGFVLIWVALGMLFFLGLAALVIDAGYLYLTKKQLSVAADSGALAGATQIFSATDCAVHIPPSPPLNGACASPDFNCNARRQAKQFAGYHKAGSGSGQTPVGLDLNVGNEANGDIVLGNFNRSLNPHFLPCSTTAPTGRPTNAVRVRARRTGESGTGIAPNARVSTFFAGILSPDFKTSGVGAYATAAKTSRPSLPIAITSCSVPASCVQPSCPTSICAGSVSSPIEMTFSPNTTQTACWTDYFGPNDLCTGGGETLIKCFVDNPYSSTCIPSVPSAPIGLDNGQKTKVFEAIAAQCVQRGGCTGTINGGDYVACSCPTATPWYIQVAVVNTGCPTPVCSGNSSIIGFATVGITEVESRSGGPLNLRPHIKTIFDNCDTVISDPGLSQCSQLVE
jgi:hypothetical protein